MNTFAGFIHDALEWAISLLDRLPDLLALTAISIATALGAVWLSGKLTQRAKLDVARDRMVAAIYEMRLFMDSPLLIARAQGRFLAWSAVYIAHSIPLCMVLAPPLAILYGHLEIRYALAPLLVGRQVLVRVETQAVDQLGIEESVGIRVTAPLLRIADEGRVYVRVQIVEPGTHELRLRAGNQVITKTLCADPSSVAVNPEKSSGFAALFAIGREPPIPADVPVTAIRVLHPLREQRWLGIEMPWWVFWFLTSSVATVVLRRARGVA